jgi:hypothetical protein
MQDTMLSGLARTQHDAAEVRCRCLVCGAHAYALPGVPLSGRCGNCHSFDLEPLDAGQPPRREEAGQKSRRRITGSTQTPKAPPHEAVTV